MSVRNRGHPEVEVKIATVKTRDKKQFTLYIGLYIFRGLIEKLNDVVKKYFISYNQAHLSNFTADRWFRFRKNYQSSDDCSRDTHADNYLKDTKYS